MPLVGGKWLHKTDAGNHDAMINRMVVVDNAIPPGA